MSQERWDEDILVTRRQLAYYASEMNRTGLQARIGYAVAAFAVAGVVGFYVSAWLLHQYALTPQSSEGEMYVVFKTAIALGVLVGISAGLVGLTLPWLRPKRRSGRKQRTVVAGVAVLLAVLVFASTGHPLFYDLAAALWLAYVVSFTYVRYGIRDRVRTVSGSSTGEGKPISANYVD